MTRSLNCIPNWSWLREIAGAESKDGFPGTVNWKIFCGRDCTLEWA